ALALTGVACRKHEPAPAAPRGCLILEGPQALGVFKATFSIGATLACEGPGGGRVVWRQIEGPALRDLEPARDGFALTARMPPLADAARGQVPWGVGALSS